MSNPEDEMKKEAARLALGATGKFHEDRKLRASDEGGLKAALSVDTDRKAIFLNFGKEVTWVSMTLEETRMLCRALNHMADELERLT